MMKDYARSFYQSKQWKATQAAYMESKYHLCERCGKVARIVHHKSYITPQNISDMNITLNWDNLEALCMDCHNSEHNSSGNAITDGLRFTDDGNIEPIPPRSGLKKTDTAIPCGLFSKPLHCFLYKGRG